MIISIINKEEDEGRNFMYVVVRLVVSFTTSTLLLLHHLLISKISVEKRATKREMLSLEYFFILS
jgi:hypothetical protein